ncbi:MAG: hypothetical protein AB7O47_13175 [Flavobacteriales bacterium]
MKKLLFVLVFFPILIFSQTFKVNENTFFYGTLDKLTQVDCPNNVYVTFSIHAIIFSCATNKSFNEVFNVFKKEETWDSVNKRSTFKYTTMSDSEKELHTIYITEGILTASKYNEVLGTYEEFELIELK